LTKCLPGCLRGSILGETGSRLIKEGGRREKNDERRLFHRKQVLDSCEALGDPVDVEATILPEQLTIPTTRLSKSDRWAREKVKMGRPPTGSWPFPPERLWRIGHIEPKNTTPAPACPYIGDCSFRVRGPVGEG